VGVIELQSEEIFRGACLPELEVGGRCELMTTGDLEPVLVEIALAAVAVDE